MGVVQEARQAGRAPHFSVGIARNFEKVLGGVEKDV